MRDVADLAGHDGEELWHEACVDDLVTTWQRVNNGEVVPLTVPEQVDA